MADLTLEQKLLRLQEIQQMIEMKKVNLTESMPLLEEAYRLKKEIEEQLNKLENKIISLSKSEESTQ
jgi:exonuclease VII small subunit